MGKSFIAAMIACGMFVALTGCDDKMFSPPPAPDSVKRPASATAPSPAAPLSATRNSTTTKPSPATTRAVRKGQPRNLVVNGGFEDGDFRPDPHNTKWITIVQDQVTIEGWTVTAGNVDVELDYWPPSEGKNSLNLVGDRPGEISQTVSTRPGEEYVVMFDLCGNPDAKPFIARLAVTAGKRTWEFGFDTTGATMKDPKWTDHQFRFKADAWETTITFTSLDTPQMGEGCVIDNVRMYAAADVD